MLMRCTPDIRTTYSGTNPDEYCRQKDPIDDVVFVFSYNLTARLITGGLITGIHFGSSLIYVAKEVELKKDS